MRERERERERERDYLIMLIILFTFICARSKRVPGMLQRMSGRDREGGGERESIVGL